MLSLLIAGLSLFGHAQSKEIWVSALDLSKATQGWGTPGKDVSVERHPITLHGTVFGHGFGTHAAGMLVVKLDHASRFTATVGIDDEVPAGKGEAEFLVLDAAHKPIWRSGVMRRGDEPKTVDLDLSGLKEIDLEVALGPDGFAYGHSDWADAKIAYSGAAPYSASPSSMKVEIAPYSTKTLLLGNVSRVNSAWQIAPTPPMGWNSYDAFGDNVTEGEVLANAQYLHRYLQPFGWDTVVVDYRWYDPGAHDNDANARAGAALTMDGNGRLLPSPNRFPSNVDGKGFVELAAKIHAMGLFFGIHIMRGIPRNAVAQNLPIAGSRFTASDAADTNDKCPWCQDMYGVRGDTPAGQAYYDSIFNLYARWGVDYVKMDDTSAPYHTHEIEAVHQAILNSRRQMTYSLSPGETPIEDASHVTKYANLWRVSGDFWDDWGSVLHEFELGDRWRAFAGPGHWPDADMLPFGHLSIRHRSVDNDRWTRFTRAEQVTVMSLWSLLNSPLMVDANLPDNDAWTLSLLSNPEVLAVDQDTLFGAANRARHSDEDEVWVKNLGLTGLAVGLFNKSPFDRTIEIPLSELREVAMASRYPLPSQTHPPIATTPVQARDLWMRRDLGQFSKTLRVTVPGHGARLISLTPN